MGRGRLYHGQCRYLGDVQYSIITPEGTNPWVPLSAAFDFTPARWGHTCVIHENKLLVMGGQQDNSGFLNDVLMVEIDPDHL